VFVHATGFDDPTVAPAPGLRVEFEMGLNPKTGKDCAVNVRVLP